VQWPENDVLLNRIARYGLPVLVLIFYLQASRYMGYTPDEGFVVPTYAAGLIDGVGLEGPPWDAPWGTPSPLWVVLVGAGGALGIDLVLTAKIFGLFFGSLAVLATYLVAVEVLDDRIVSLCVALLVATGPWLMVTAVAGDGIALALALSMAGLFFYLRRDLLVGVLMLALAGLVVWPALLLGILCVADDLRRAPAGAQRRRRGTVAGVLLLSVFVGWGLLAWRLGAGIIPLPTGPAGEPDPVTFVMLCVFAIIGVGGILLASARGRVVIVRQSRFPLVVLWCAIGVVAGLATNTDAFLLSSPVLLMCGFLGLVVLRPPLSGDGHLRLGPVFVVTALLLLGNQAGLYLFTRPKMLAGTGEVAQLESAASWVRASMPANATVASDHPWTLAYLAGTTVRPYDVSAVPPPEFVVLARGTVPGYVRAYRAPIELGPDGAEVLGEVSVWRKPGE